MRRGRLLHRLQQQWLVLALVGRGGREHRQLISVLQLAAGSHHHLHVPFLAELAEHVLVEAGLLHARGLEGALVARAGAVAAHVHVVGGGRVRARYLGANLARLRRAGRSTTASRAGPARPGSLLSAILNDLTSFSTALGIDERSRRSYRCVRPG